MAVPDAEACRGYAATVHDQGLCAKRNGYGPDCDGPPVARAPWCAQRPLGCWRSRNGCTYFKESGNDEPQLDVRPVCQILGRAPPSPDSLYCFALLATSEDRHLLAMQASMYWGVFACDNFTVFGVEGEAELTQGALGLYTSSLPSKVRCGRRPPHSPECKGVEVFLEVWKQVLHEGRFRDFAWTLKAEADAVFVPSKVRSAVRGIWDPPRGVYVATCHQGDRFSLSASLEAFSRNAVEVYGRGSHLCLDGPTRLHYDGLSEVRFMDECMQKLGVYRRLDESFLLEPNCSGWSEADHRECNQEVCSSEKYAAFHPFRQERCYKECALIATA